MKDVMEKACGLELAPGLDAKSAEIYMQKFVRAPVSLHPPARPEVMQPSMTHEAMRITMGK